MAEFFMTCTGCGNTCRLEVYGTLESLTVLGNRCGVGCDEARKELSARTQSGTAVSRNLHIGAIYRHFKGDRYLVEDVVTHSESGECLVLYRQLYGECRRFVRPLDMFLSEVDHAKYPEVQQTYRLEEEHIASVNHSR